MLVISLSVIAPLEIKLDLALSFDHSNTYKSINIFVQAFTQVHITFKIKEPWSLAKETQGHGSLCEE